MNRQERRKANSGKANHYSVASREIFTTPNLGRSETNLDVERMREWAKKHIEPQKIPIDLTHVERLLQGGTVDPLVVLTQKVNQPPKPILLCEHPEGLGDEIVDGNHAYVAAALQWDDSLKLGLVQSKDVPFVVGYGLTPTQWRQFVVPKSRLRKAP